MKISDYLKLQRDFDRFVLSIWKYSPQSCLRACAFFSDRVTDNVHDSAPEDVQSAVEQRMKDLHIRRRPDLLSVWARRGIGGWMFASYPDLFDKIAECGDVSKIDLSTLRYIPNAKVPKRMQRPTAGDLRNNLTLKALQTKALTCKGGGNKKIRSMRSR